MPTHTDQSLLSFTIALNDPSEYEGGGTFFYKLGRAIDAPAAGHVVMFPGKVSHGGYPISKGTRYIIVLFMGYEENRTGRREGHTLELYERLSAGGAPTPLPEGGYAGARSTQASNKEEL